MFPSGNARGSSQGSVAGALALACTSALVALLLLIEYPSANEKFLLVSEHSSKNWSHVPHSSNPGLLSPDLRVDLKAEVLGCPSHLQGNEECAFDGVVYALGAGEKNLGPWAAVHIPPAGRAQVDAHGSNILQLPDGALITTWFSGAEDDDGVAIVTSRLEAGSTKWTEPQVVSAEEGRSAQNPVLFCDGGAVYLLHTSQQSYSGQGTSEVRWLKSTDGGRTWSQPASLFKEAGAFVRNQMLPSRTSGWLLPMYYTPNGFGDFESHYSVMKWTEDKGHHWEEAKMTEPGDWLAQPTVTRLTNGTLLGFHRDRQGMYLYSTMSNDEGRTWTKPKKTRVPNNNSGIQVTTLKSGVLALVFNNLQGGARTPLSIALSGDSGSTWPYVRDLDTTPGGDFSYPSIIEGADGLIHVTYTYNRESIKYIRVSSEWVKHGGSIGQFGSSMNDERN
mmetsp:Transcript_19130/g.36609  ORF Transcript_19130/g.36609 Transcript_19130/m.36609 type:complete len:447 (+) Transcript_19130:316-1656(+)|eukprot:CAMPEP_0114260156 /NCGR_PEP_ID=MMETSP0058-20121206/20311_1 /TAXON_ID=36894 /ORGANISM="Pyramimonas parkeae, CCMP726" /LENGTH=446 /DNA_ID=CAMNT_0001375321 /DNA_START=241 /DNA_END=1581 /DNA_ORIENTATION=+